MRVRSFFRRSEMERRALKKRQRESDARNARKRRTHHLGGEEREERLPFAPPRGRVVYVVATDFIANYIAAKRTPLITPLPTTINHRTRMVYSARVAYTRLARRVCRNRSAVPAGVSAKRAADRKVAEHTRQDCVSI